MAKKRLTAKQAQRIREDAVTAAREEAAQRYARFVKEVEPLIEEIVDSASLVVEQAAKKSLSTVTLTRDLDQSLDAEHYRAIMEGCSSTLKSLGYAVTVNKVGLLNGFAIQIHLQWS
ncbi:MAG: hypothetical protein ACKO0Z_21335 [Betaproteobacteria bacterium]